MTTTDPATPPNVPGVLFATLRALADRLVATDPLADAPISPLNVHDARGAARRARSLLRSYASLFERGWASDARADLAFYPEVLAPLHDLDVVTSALTSAAERVARGSELYAALALVARARFGEIERLSARSGSKRHRRARRRAEAMLDEGFVAARSDSARPGVEALLRRPYRDVREAAAVALREPDDRRLHDLRIRARDLRYAAGVIGAAGNSRASDLARAARRVQDRLGAPRDALIAATFLENAGADLTDGAALIADLVAYHRVRAELDLDALRRDLRRVRRRYKAFRAGATRVESA